MGGRKQRCYLGAKHGKFLEFVQANDKDCIINEKVYQEPAGSWNIEFLAYFLNYQKRPSGNYPTRPF